ncbi:TPA: hypothetical protein DCX16_03445 [bacterium]|nr:hypothetical protein [bacterium]
MEVLGYFIGFFSLVITFLMGVLTYLAWSNGKWMKIAHNDTRSLIKETHNDTVELIKWLGKLIVADGEKTRELVRQFKADLRVS